MELVLDEPDDKDVVEDFAGVRIFMRRELKQQLGTVSIDYDGLEFHIGTEHMLSVFCQ